MDVCNVTNSYAKYELRLLSSINGVTIGTQIPDASFNPLDNSIVEYFAPSTPVTINGGYVLTSGTISTRSSTVFGTNDYETLLTRANCTQYDTIAIICTVVSGNPEIIASIDFIESM